jgi:hypothetical protein
MSEIKDLIEISNCPEAEHEALLKAAYLRGVVDGKQEAKRIMIEALNN